jgi:hypothetical protein
MSDRLKEPLCVFSQGLSLFSGKDWDKRQIRDQDITPLVDGLTDKVLQERLLKDPIGALCFLRGQEMPYRGRMGGQSLGANIVVAYILAWFATRKENTRETVLLFISMHWGPLKKQIEKARAPEDINKEGPQDWAQEKWTETQELFDGLTVEVIKAAAAFFQRAFFPGLGVSGWVARCPYQDDSEESDSEESDSEESDSEESDSEERPLKRKRDSKQHA